MSVSDNGIGQSTDGAGLLDVVLAHYRRTLAETPRAIEWLVEHGIVSGGVVDVFDLGFADRSLGLSLPPGGAGRNLRGQLKRIGILRETGHELFRGCVVLPIRDSAGRVVQCYGRRVQHPKCRAGAASAEVLWLPTPATGIWNPQALASAEVIVADSPLDGLVWWSAGFPRVIAAGGPAGLPEQLGPLLVEAGVTRVLLAQARTPDGDRVAEALAAQLAMVKADCFRVVFPYGCDAAMLARDTAGAAEVLGERLRAAVWLGGGPVPPRAARQPRSDLELRSTAPPDEQGPLAFAVDAETDDEGGLVASPIPPSAPAACDVDVDGGELRMTMGGVAWRVRGLDHVTGQGSLRVTVSARDVDTGAFHLDTVDLFCARTRAQFLATTAAELGLPDAQRLRRDLAQLLLACEDRVLDLQHQARQPETVTPAMTLAEEQAALELLRDPGLLDRISADIAAMGVVGERDNALLAYLAATSRLLDTPLALVIQSGSASGKSTLIDAALSLMPAEAQLTLSAITGQSLFYLAEGSLAHKVLSVAEVDGAQRATYALRSLTGDGELSIASTGKDPTSGALVTRTYRVHGPVALFLTTTAADLNDELMNRALVLGVDDDQVQTAAILAAQRHAQTVDGLIARHDRQALRALHANAQRLLEPLDVVIPFAPRLTFADRRTRARRDQAKLLTLIRAVALLHQHQRPRQRITRRGLEVVFIEATPDDVAIAERLAAGVIGRPDLADLAPQTRRLLDLLDTLVATDARAHHCSRGDIRFTRRRAREHTGWSDYALRRHLARLVQLEFVLVHRAGNAFTYELLWSEHNDTRDDVRCKARDYDQDLDAPAWTSRGHLTAISRPVQSQL